MDKVPVIGVEVEAGGMLNVEGLNIWDEVCAGAMLLVDERPLPLYGPRTVRTLSL